MRSTLVKAILLFGLLMFVFPTSINAQEIIGNITPPDGSLEDVTWDMFEAIWSPDGSLFAVSTVDQLIIYDQRLNIKTIITQRIYDFDWSPDSQRVAFVQGRDYEPKIYIWKRQTDDTFAEFQVLTSPNTNSGILKGVVGVSWSPDGQHLGHLSLGGLNQFEIEVHIWDTETWISTVKSHEAFLHDPEYRDRDLLPLNLQLLWSPESQMVATWGYAYCHEEIALTGLCSTLQFGGINLIDITTGMIVGGRHIDKDAEFFIWTFQNHIIRREYTGIPEILNATEGELEKIQAHVGTSVTQLFLTPWDDLILARRNHSIALWHYMDDTIIFEVPLDNLERYGQFALYTGYGWIPGQSKFFIIDNEGNVEVWDVSSIISLPD